ncbi:MAG TPA: cation:proton antiporter, partial [Candidatus Saccharimonadia bacterium]|nr:cation:proton antiporter [Candidatus Saccharimonadia bacterium]
MHHTLLQDLAIVMMVAAVVTVVFRRLKQPVVLGYILAGVIIGPHTPPYAFIEDRHTIETLSELGVIFLMFALGLEFSLRKLSKVGATALIAATMEIVLMVWVGYQIGKSFGWHTMDSVFLGAILAISSTTIIIKALEELGKTKESFAQLIFGILIVEDILAILMIAMLSGFADRGELSAAEVGITVGKLSAFLGVLLVAGLIIVPRLLNYVAKFKSNEMLLVTVTGLCFGVSLLAVKMGYSVALGAFLIGAIIAEARQIARIEMLMHPVRDLFSAVFFVSIGLLIDPKVLWEHIVPITVITTAVVLGKVLTCGFGTFVAGNDLRSSMRVGMGLAQIGEFSFIIAAFGLQKGVTSEFLYPIAVAVSALTTLFTPYLIRSSDTLVGWSEKVMPVSVRRALDAYTHWVGQLSKSGSRRSPSAFLRKWGWQIALNLLLIAGVFIGAFYVRRFALQWWPHAPGGDNGIKGMLWLSAMLLSLPMIIAVVRKWQAFAMLLSEMSVTRKAAGKNTAAMRAVVQTIAFVAGCVALMIYLLLLSSAVLPSWNLLIVLALVLLAATLLLRRSFIRLHSRAQIALMETFDTPAAPHPHEAVAADVHPLLREAQLDTITVSPTS